MKFKRRIIAIIVASALGLLAPTPSLGSEGDQQDAIRAAERFVTAGYNDLTPQPYNPYISAAADAKALRQLYTLHTLYRILNHRDLGVFLSMSSISFPSKTPPARLGNA